MAREIRMRAEKYLNLSQEDVAQINLQDCSKKSSAAEHALKYLFAVIIQRMTEYRCSLFTSCYFKFVKPSDCSNDSRIHAPISRFERITFTCVDKPNRFKFPRVKFEW